MARAPRCAPSSTRPPAPPGTATPGPGAAHHTINTLLLLVFRQVEASPGKKVAETKCEQLPVNICGAGCFTQEAEQEECEDEEVITSAS